MATSYLGPGVYVEEADRGSKPIEAVGTNTVGFLGESPKGPQNEAILITNWSQFVKTFGDFQGCSVHLAHAVYGFFNNGGSRCFVVNVGPPRQLAKDHALPVELAVPPPRLRLQPDLSKMSQEQARKFEEALHCELVANGLAPRESDPASTALELAVSTEQLSGRQVRRLGQMLTGEIAGDPAVDRQSQSYLPRDERFVGRDRGPGQRSGLACLDEVDEIALVAAPGQTSRVIQEALLEHCETRKDRFAILDSPETVEGGVDRLPRPRDSKYGAYYFPWIQVYDPEKGNIFVPPSGHIAGIYSRVDIEHGVHKAPANEIVRGAQGLKYDLSKDAQDLLNPKGINAIRTMSGAIRIWAARTLSSDPSWKYINVRRLFIMVESSIEMATQWVVFEPNDHRLWKRVERTISSFLTLLWRSGALMGTAPEQAFYVKCDEETNPPEVIDADQLIVEIGLAPVKPDEFVIFRIGQMASGGGVDEQ